MTISNYKEILLFSIGKGIEYNHNKVSNELLS